MFIEIAFLNHFNQIYLTNSPNFLVLLRAQSTKKLKQQYTIGRSFEFYI